MYYAVLGSRRRGGGVRPQVMYGRFFYYMYIEAEERERESLVIFPGGSTYIHTYPIYATYVVYIYGLFTYDYFVY